METFTQRHYIEVQNFVIKITQNLGAAKRALRDVALDALCLQLCASYNVIRQANFSLRLTNEQ